MLGSFITRGLVLILGYAYPAYECYKTVEKNKPEIEQLLFWCQYWILVAFMTVLERVGDTFVSWVPMYSEVKLLFFIYLWHPRMKGTTYVYDSFFKPYLAKHENEIDRNLLELRARAGDMAVVYWQRAASYGQTRVFDILQYVAAQSTPRPRPPQPPAQQGGGRVRQPPATVAAPPPPPPEEPPSPTSSTSSSQYQKEIKEELASTEAPKITTTKTVVTSTIQKLVSGPSPSTAKPPPMAAPAVAAKAPAEKPAASKTAVASSSAPKATVAIEKSISAPAELEPMEADPVPEAGEGNSASKEMVMEDAIRVTRGRLRKTRSTKVR